MANDIREQILARLAVVLQGVEGIKYVGRNTQDVPELQRPCVVLHDGNEELDESFGRPDLRGRLQMQAMTPQINVFFSTNAKATGNIANTYRAKLLAAIFNDATLTGLLFDQEIRYQGCTLVPADVTEGRETRLEVEIVFTYPFRVSDFTS